MDHRKRCLLRAIIVATIESGASPGDITNDLYSLFQAQTEAAYRQGRADEALEQSRLRLRVFLGGAFAPVNST